MTNKNKKKAMKCDLGQGSIKTSGGQGKKGWRQRGERQKKGGKNGRKPKKRKREAGKKRGEEEEEKKGRRIKDGKS